MATQEGCSYYNSHSFGQRVTPFGDGFLFMSQGDCYPRAFTLCYTSIPQGISVSWDIFHFWVKKGALTDWDMGTLNNTMARIGDFTLLPNGKAAFVACSAKNLNSTAASQKQQLFIQIFDPRLDLTKASSYVTSGTRSGLGGPDGDENVIDYGVKWLTNYSDREIKYPQAVEGKDGNTIILYELYKESADRYGNYLGVYSIVVDKNGNIIKPAKCIARRAYLNHCETPVYKNGSVFWTSNKQLDDANHIYTYEYKPYASGADSDATTKLSIKAATVYDLYDQYYTGSAIKPSPTVYLDSAQLKEGKDYTVSYKNNVKVGEATLEITGKGDFSGTIKKTFKILPSYEEQENDYEEPYYQEESDNKETKKEDIPAIKKGETYTKKGLIYKVTSVKKKKKKGNVTLIGTTKSKKKLKKLKVPESVKINGYTLNVTAIGANAFKDYKKLTTVTIGTKVTKIGKCAFFGDKKLKTIKIKSLLLKSVGKNSIIGIYKKAKITVPPGKQQAYMILFSKKTGFTKKMKLK